MSKIPLKDIVPGKHYRIESSEQNDREIIVEAELVSEYGYYCVIGGNYCITNAIGDKKFTNEILQFDSGKYYAREFRLNLIKVLEREHKMGNRIYNLERELSERIEKFETKFYILIAIVSLIAILL